MTDLDPKLLARALGIAENSTTEQLVAAIENPPAPRVLHELGPVVASAPTTHGAPDLSRRFLPELSGV